MNQTLNISPKATDAGASTRTPILLGAVDDVAGILSHNLLSNIFATCAVFDPANWEIGSQTDQQVFPVILLDATQGVRERDRVHARLARFFPLTPPLILVGRLDEIGFEQEQYDLIVEEYHRFLSTIGVKPLLMLPASLEKGAQIEWYDGPGLGAVTALQESSTSIDGSPLRIRVVSVVNADGRWHLDGTLLSGQVVAGDRILSSPSNQTAVVDNVQQDAEGGIALVFHEPFFADPGEVLSHINNAPIETDVFRACVRWSGVPAKIGETLQCETSYGTVSVTLQSIDLVMDPLKRQVLPHDRLVEGVFCEIILRTENIVAVDCFAHMPSGGEMQLVDGNGEAVCSGFISMEGYADQRQLLTAKATNITPVQYAVTEKDRSDRNGHEGGVLWFTGLSGSGKSTLAIALEARLFKKGYQVFVMDGDNVRRGLASNLGFSPDDRAENIRRAGEVAALFRQAGVIVISSFISPYRSDRDRARHAAQSGFHEIYIKADVETCISRDPKGLYKRALSGDIRDFTGISAPYEEPGAADLVIDTQGEGVDACVDLLVKYVDRNFRV